MHAHIEPIAPTSIMPEKISLKENIFNYATQSLGFDDCRFTGPHLSNTLEVYKRWLKENYHGDMDYLKTHLKFKEDPDLLLTNVKSAIVLIKNYRNTNERRLKNTLKISRYAVGKDYHTVIREKLARLSDFIKREDAAIECYCGVDSSPLPERSLALKAGIGFLGKNSMVIKPGLGSYFFIGVILTTHDFKSDKPMSWNCGKCHLCIDACPTRAITDKNTVNATKCISYQTIEQKSPMTKNDIRKAEGWLFGCDICQEVCPYNHDNTPLTNWTEFLPQAGVGFDFFDKSFDGMISPIPKTTPLHRSRNRIFPNLQTALNIFKKK